MLHNSLASRELLQAFNDEPLVRARRDPHRSLRARPGVVAPPGSVAPGPRWHVDSGAAGDAAERLGADVRRVLDGLPDGGGQGLVRVALDDGLEGFRASVTDGAIEIGGRDVGALWAGWTWVEGELRLSGALAPGVVVRAPAWDVQVAPPAWGASMYVPDLGPAFLPDDALAGLAHQGADGLLLYGDLMVYSRHTRLAELDHPDAAAHLATLADLADRARTFGIRLWWVPVTPKLRADHPLFSRLPGTRGARLGDYLLERERPLHNLCSSDPDALGWHADVIGGLVEAVPDIGGLVLIVGCESYYHCYMRPDGSPHGATNCTRCAARDPADVVSGLVQVTHDAVRERAPAARVVAWPYQAHTVWSASRDQLELIDALPAGTGFLAEVDAGQSWWKGEWRKEAWDYSLDHDRVSDRAVAQGLACARRGRDFWLKTETAHGLELLQLPYTPALGRSARKWQSVRSARPRGVIQRWGFVGMFDSAAERLGWLARWDPSFAPDEAVERVARQLVGPAAADPVVRAWRAFDEAVGRIPTLTLCHYYVGPTFLGPAHPLPLWDGETPDVFCATLFYLAEERESFDVGRLDARDDILMTRADQAVDLPRGCPPEQAWSIVEREFAAARDAARDGSSILSAIDDVALGEGDRAELEEQRALGEQLYRSFRTTLNVLLAIRLRDGGQTEALREVVADEHENTVAAQELLRRAPWLDLRLRSDMRIAASADMLAAKLGLLSADAADTPTTVVVP